MKHYNYFIIFTYQWYFFLDIDILAPQEGTFNGITYKNSTYLTHFNLQNIFALIKCL
jgi:hypothetical protein